MGRINLLGEEGILEGEDVRGVVVVGANRWTGNVICDQRRLGIFSRNELF